MTRLNVNINDESEWYLREASVFDDVSVTEIIRQAIGMHKLFNDLIAAGYELAVRDKETDQFINIDQAIRRGVPGRFTEADED